MCRASGWRRERCDKNSPRNQVIVDAGRRNFIHLDNVGADGKRYATFERYGANDEGNLPEVLDAFSEHDEEDLERVLGTEDEDDDDG